MYWGVHERSDDIGWGGLFVFPLYPEQTPKIKDL
ncbi:hypothetical protein BOCO_0721 [Bombiscardovia coagulans]|uniref:Uncharacterized protein n=1 Tax=Bombiscardovia coagulans TaxID=686666 RepID=A0A261ETL3_9BIFI|nr:hypothetical protein BOCO_0721 [Bombiscardovia coagulans]